MAGKEQDLTPLKTPSFAAIFAADLEPELVTCTVGDGLECRFWLRMMDSGDLGRFNSLGVKIRNNSDGTQTREADLAIDARAMFLVSHTLVDWDVWHRPRKQDGTLADWQKAGAPEHKRQREKYIEDNFRCVPEFWDWLATECLRVNGLIPEIQGNLPAP